jgi:hypothetical protein
MILMDDDDMARLAKAVQSPTGPLERKLAATFATQLVEINKQKDAAAIPADARRAMETAGVLILKLLVELDEAQPTLRREQ